MDSDLKAEWIRALRSGNYSQCKHRMREGDSFSSLGVLADVLYHVGIGHWGTAPRGNGIGWYWRRMTEYGDYEKAVPFFVSIPRGSEPAGLTLDDIELCHRLNDRWGWGFNQQATVIENTIEG